MSEFQEAFEDLIKDMYSAEKQVVKALPKAAKAATDDGLREAIQEHIQQTEEHVNRLEKVAELGEFKPSGKVCAAAKGIIEEMAEALEEHEPGPILDAVMVCAAQKFEHYEIANYGTAVSWAKLLGLDDCVEVLQQTLEEEEQSRPTSTGTVRKIQIASYEDSCHRPLAVAPSPRHPITTNR
jgi:ferritin-like metal-binding protein YciE